MLVRVTCLAATLFATACFHPAPEIGSPCANGEPCPSGQVCNASTLTCDRSSTEIDAPQVTDDAPLPDPDAPDAPPGATCIGSMLIACTMNVPTDVVDLPMTIDTTSSPLCGNAVELNQLGTCVIAGRVIRANDNVRVTGDKPLVLVAFDRIEIDADLDVSSHASPASIGAGADTAGCGTGGTPASGDGGPGGSFGTRGGKGGAAIDSAPTITATMLRGGCPGKMGGTSGGAGGHGGGAIGLIARDSIDLGGAINASGAGGGAGTNNGNAGGGGGSGGMIVLDAPLVNFKINGELFANGGGGGSSFGFTAGSAGAESGSWNDKPDGGTNLYGSAGGNGYFNATAATDGTKSPYPGSGGGGGAGVIKSTTTIATTEDVSPPAGQ